MPHVPGGVNAFTPQSAEIVARRRPFRHDAGFTLIELLVVLVILGLLAALAGPRVLNYLSGAKVDTAKLQINNLSAALDLFRLDTGNFPTTQQGLQALIVNNERMPGWKGPYLDSKELPKDPWGTRLCVPVTRRAQPL